jgi:hypothetical protein
MIGLSGGLTDFLLGDCPIFYYLSVRRDHCHLAGTKNELELPNWVIKPEWRSDSSEVIGCGILLDSNGKVQIFFTLNGNLLGQFC